MEKITKNQIYEMIKAAVAGNENEDTIVTFCDKEIAALAAKAEKAKVRAAEKKAEGDELRGAVESVLTNDLQTGEQILAQIEGEDLTKAKIVARCTQLVKSGVAVKEKIKVDGREVVAYRLAD